jgi:alpha-N-acetylglucosaminidase
LSDVVKDNADDGSSATFWTNERIEAYLSGVDNESMIVLDLFSESQPQWQRTNSYYGKPWIWCELHDYGGNMGLYGQIENLTSNPIEALGNSSSTMVGMGLTMEGQEGNEIVYDLLLDQAWQPNAIDTDAYFHEWVTARYHGAACLPVSLYSAWNILRQTVYNNTNLSLATSVTKSIFELAPNTTGLLNRTGHHATTITYDPAVLVTAWKDLYTSASTEPTLWDNPAYTFDLTDVTRQVMANAFYPLYNSFITATNGSLNGTYSSSSAEAAGTGMIALLRDLETVLAASGQPYFNLATWIASARAWADPCTNSTYPTNTSSTSAVADFYEYNARNQITLWGPDGEISDYASKQWAGLISSYHVPRWERFVHFTLKNTTSSTGVNTALSESLRVFELAWQGELWGEKTAESFAGGLVEGELSKVLGEIIGRWKQVFV